MVGHTEGNSSDSRRPSGDRRLLGVVTEADLLRDQNLFRPYVIYRSRSGGPAARPPRRGWERV
jgi:hypothetical protein